jgi:hypothetical protein
LLGVDPGAAIVVYEAITVIATPRGLDWSWQRDDNGTVELTVARSIREN